MQNGKKIHITQNICDNVNIDRFAGSHGRKGEGGRGWHQGKRADTSLHSMIYDGTFGVNS